MSSSDWRSSGDFTLLEQVETVTMSGFAARFAERLRLSGRAL
jgi:hypothetical protein